MLSCMLGLQDWINYRKPEARLSVDQIIKSDCQQHWFTLITRIMKKNQQWNFSMMRFWWQIRVFPCHNLSQSSSQRTKSWIMTFEQPVLRCSLCDCVFLHVIKTAGRKKGSQQPSEEHHCPQLEDRDLEESCKLTDNLGGRISESFRLKVSTVQLIWSLCTEQS